MLRSLKWKFLLYGAITAFCILLLMPTVTSELPQWWSKIIPAEKIHLGLDLQGGMHLLLGVQGDKAVESYMEQIKNNLRDDLKERSIPVGKLEAEKKGQIALEFSGAIENVYNLLSKRFTMLLELSSSGGGGGIWKYQ